RSSLALAELSPPLQIGLALVGLVVLAAALLLLLAWQWPVPTARWVLWLPARLLYSIRVFGRENVPERGPGLLVCNHVSFIDALLILFTEKRPVRFVIWAPFTKVPGLRVLLHLGQV